MKKMEKRGRKKAGAFEFPNKKKKIYYQPASSSSRSQNQQSSSFFASFSHNEFSTLI
jgi:hypothetical protein